YLFFFFQAEDGIRDRTVTGVQTCALPISAMSGAPHFVAAFVTAGRGFTTPEGGIPMQHIEDWSRRQGVAPPNNPRPTIRTWGPKIGRASCRERVWISWGGGVLKEK